MRTKNLLVDSRKNFFAGHTQSNKGEVTSQTEVDVERTGLRVHASSKHEIDNFKSLREFVSVIDNTVIEDLSAQSNRRLGTVFINLRHVKVIHEEDEFLTCWGTIDLTNTFLNSRLQEDLESLRVGVGVEVNAGGLDKLGVNISEIVLKDGGLTSTSLTNVKHTSSGDQMHVKQELLTSGFGSRNNEVNEKTIEVGVVAADLLLPVNPVAGHRVEEVVVNSADFGELDLLGHTLEVVGERNLLIINQSSAERPNHTKDKEAFVDKFNLIFVTFFSKFLEMFNLLLVSIKSVVKHVNNSGQGDNVTHVSHRSDSFFVMDIIKELIANVVGLSQSKLTGGSFILGLESVHPRVIEWLPTNIKIVNKEYTTS
mmetsp:Transcript_116895/g.162393  ORF Transcript_116895/g.162393 Transcript_116895/m.162393 type:complete len:369 (-) Transcript_116895:3811-4917(-)